MVIATQWVYRFRDGNAQMRDLLGGKGANLAEMTRIGLPVPPGFTITTQACVAFLEGGRQFPEGLWDEVLEGLRDIEQQMGRRFGDARDPLLVSVRSGAKFSMPGMMDTILNLGLNDQTVEGLAARTGDQRFAFDCYRRLIQMFGKVVLDIDAELFEDVIDEHKRELGIQHDHEIPAEHLQRMVEEFKAIVERKAGRSFPQDCHEQLRLAIIAVFDSWNNRRAIDYRNAHGIPHNLGTAVNVQAMVFGNMGPDSATGVAFTRNPSTGEKGIFGEYLINAQGEDVVAGIRTPQPIHAMRDDPLLRPAYEQLLEVAERLERHYRDMQDLEFTVEHGKLYMLQARTGKRTGRAAVKIAVDMVREGLIEPREAVQRVSPDQVEQLLHPMIDLNWKGEPLARGLPASPGAAYGKVVFDADEAKAWAERGEPVILVRLETSPDDFHGMLAAQAVLTARGGMTSHAAVVARGIGKPAVVGCSALEVDYERQEFRVDSTVVRKGDFITVDGSTGAVMLGQIPTVAPAVGGDLSVLLSWADEIRRLGVRANADTPEDAAKARELGAEGIGLCRTEHMFFQGDRITAMREMILAQTVEERRAALAKLEPMQREDFIGIFKAMAGFPVTIRTLDPPLHEFLPRSEEEIEAVARDLGVSPDLIRAKVEALHEANPMLGHRGCRLGITAPEITEMQARAIFSAALHCAAEGIEVHPEIMIPLVADVQELRRQREVIDRVARELFAEAGREIPYSVGTMIELPRAALTADEIAQEAEFFSFGTNDLTQTTFGLSRDDSGRFLPFYIEQGIFPADPFQTLDRKGVGRLIEIARDGGRSTRPDLKLGICGEHGGDPKSVWFCHGAGLDYVSASPYRVPVARLAAAQAALGEREGDV
ncbi:pyruvate, phosphate dikinase [Thermomicrobiaceae bacterium CFH 74404]|uniref:Pyruvate, phosphate dikinase n=1 Tax=Thermalbibacter longus TaxID=2951981 RepID=A0AA41W9C1_9BACT|nr:pyruvate, phosphate dikinase [Thermalbibacter longus]MCM8747964.1 pyruvate, phosphate dikinase [Thermalbibacter longus]